MSGPPSNVTSAGIVNERGVWSNGTLGRSFRTDQTCYSRFGTLGEFPPLYDAPGPELRIESDPSKLLGRRLQRLSLTDHRDGTVPSGPTVRNWLTEIFIFLSIIILEVGHVEK